MAAGTTLGSIALQLLRLDYPRWAMRSISALRSTTMVETTQASKDATVIEKPAWDRKLSSPPVTADDVR
jgi:hypothetical protein